MTPILLVALGLARPLAPDSDLTYPRVRPDDRVAQSIVWDGARASSTIARLIATLEASDIVVYVQTRAGLGSRGKLTFLARAAGLTYVRIQIDATQPPRNRLATLAHELTHAVEIAETSCPLQSEADLAALYRTIGLPGVKRGEFESLRALENERRVRGELTHTM